MTHEIRIKTIPGGFTYEPTARTALWRGMSRRR